LGAGIEAGNPALNVLENSIVIIFLQKINLIKDFNQSNSPEFSQKYQIAIYDTSFAKVVAVTFNCVFNNLFQKLYIFSCFLDAYN